MKETIVSHISTQCPWRDTVYWYPSTDSTNTQAKALARNGAPQGTVVIAGVQSAGRGRLGRSFCSHGGMGVYLSVILRPGCRPEQLMHLTCAAGIAACQAVEKAAGIRPGIKWINDLILEGKKLGGILTELSLDPEGLVDFAVIGIGINCLQEIKDFPSDLQSTAISLKAAGQPVAPAAVCGALVEALFHMSRQLIKNKADIMDAYKESCITLGREIVLNRADTTGQAKAIDLDENGGLLVQFSDGSTQWVRSGEASIRGIAGYV